MGIGSKLLDNSYIPSIENTSTIRPFYFKPIIKCPVKFTIDPFEYAESAEFLGWKLRPFQKNILEDLFSEDEKGFPKYDISIIIVGMRCLGLGTEVLMYDKTLKKVENIVIGELVMGPDSTPRKVLNTSRGKSELFKVKQSHAMEYIVNENHILSLKNSKIVKNYISFPDIINISIKDYFKKSVKWKHAFRGYKATIVNFKEHYNENLSFLNIKSIGIGEYAGIEVDKDNLYCLSDCTVTHNSGKSAMSGLVGSFLLQKLLAMDDPAGQLHQLPGDRLSAEYIATSEEQSKQTAYAKFKMVITESNWWNKYIQYLLDRETTEGKETLFQNHARRIYFPEKNLDVLSCHSNSQSLAGLTCYFVNFDELSRFDVSDNNVQNISEKRTATAVYNTASRSAKSLYPFSKIMCVTSPMYELDYGCQMLYQAQSFRGGKHKAIFDLLRKKYYPEKMKRAIGYCFTTFEANPLSEDNPNGFTPESFIEERNTNYAAYLRDYEALPPSAINPFFEHSERIDEAINILRRPVVLFEDTFFSESVTTEYGVETRNYIGKNITPLISDKFKKYFICCDAGEKKDSFAVAMGHAEEFEFESIDPMGKPVKEKRQKIIIDFSEVWIPNKNEKIIVSFSNVEDVIRILNKHFNIGAVAFDTFQSSESIQRLFSEGIFTKKIGATLEMYNIMKLLMYNSMLELPNNEILKRELRQLNIINKKVGNTFGRVEHPPEGSKDIADAVVRVVWCVYEDSIRDAIQGEHILPMGQRFSTSRSMMNAYDMRQQGNNPNFGEVNYNSIFTGGEVFGQGSIVRSNVVTNLPFK